MDFNLHPALERDCVPLGRFDLCQALLMNDANYPWVILVPQLAGIREAYELSKKQQIQLLEESNFVLQVMSKAFDADKMNQAALGNIVPQLHIHHIARYKDDPAWPAPVWGKVLTRPYASDELKAMVTKLNQAFSNHHDYVEISS